MKEAMPLLKLRCVRFRSAQAHVSPPHQAGCNAKFQDKDRRQFRTVRLV
jgi:hypothetical protein